MNTRHFCLQAAMLFGALAAAAEEAAPAGPDADSDGVVTFEEFQAFRVARALVNDADGDGVLTLEEFRPTLPERLPRMTHGRAFERIDTDGDDLIVPAELEAAPARAFEEADADGDGQLTAEELARFRNQ